MKLRLSIIFLGILFVLVVGAVVYDNMYPSTTATYDLGTSTLKWKDGYFSGDILASTLSNLERSTDPDIPEEGYSVIWLSDGTELGDDGDLMVASKAGGTANYGTLFDHSGGTFMPLRMITEAGDSMLTEAGEEMIYEDN